VPPDPLVGLKGGLRGKREREGEEGDGVGEESGGKGWKKEKGGGGKGWRDRVEEGKGGEEKGTAG